MPLGEGDPRSGPVLDNHHRQAVFTIEPGERVQQRRPAGLIQMCGGLVQDEGARAHGEHRGEGHALELPAGQGVRVAGLEAPESHGVQGPAGPRLGLPGIQPQVQWAKEDLIPDREVEKLRRGPLEDQGQVLGRLPERLPGRIPAEDGEDAFPVPGEDLGDHACEGPGEGGLAAARGPGEEDALPLADGEVHSLEEAHRPGTDPEP